MLKGVIFDVDGTLVASNDAHARAWIDVLSEAGHEVSFDVVWPAIGMGSDKVLPAVAGIESDSAKGKELTKRRWEIFERDYLPSLRPTPGARALVARLADDGLKLIVATSAGGSEAGDLLDAAGVRDLMDAATSASDAGDSKPDPDIVLAAIKKSGVNASNLIMIGDTPYDVQAATSAGVKLIAFRSGGWSNEELSGAVAIYDNPADLLAWYERSPTLLQDFLA